jgi:putative zinc finger/helix-turn-helix YgiT family protein
MLMSNENNPGNIRPFPWKCGRCQQREVNPTEGEYSTEVLHDGRTYMVTVPSLRTFRCRNCGEVVLDTEANKQISRAFRHQAGLLMPEQIRQNREHLHLTQKELAERLSLAEATLSRWENGWQIQQRSLDKLLRLFFELPEVRRALQLPSRGKFRCLQTTEELRRRSKQFRLMGSKNTAICDEREEPAKETAEATAVSPVAE